jgi:hypothetical protein
MNREQWLTEVAVLAQRLFTGYHLAPYRVTCGWPCRNPLGRRVRTLGECHALETSRGGVHELFISPLLDDPAEVSGVLMHELTHVAAGMKAAHGKDFVKVARHVGLTRGTPKTLAPGDYLAEQLARITEKVGAYPHKAIVPQPRPEGKPTVARLECDCGCKATMSLKHLDRYGPPTCACGQPMAQAEPEED